MREAARRAAGEGWGPPEWDHLRLERFSMHRSIPALALGFALAGCQGGDTADVAALEACHDYAQLEQEVATGALRAPELRARLRMVAHRAKRADDSLVKHDARALLRTVAAGRGRQAYDSVAARMSVACLAYAE